MSGPICRPDDDGVDAIDEPHRCEIEVTEGRTATVGAISVNRLVPRRTRRTVGAWCFVDHMGPASMTDTGALDVGPHPHIGLQTVTWLLDGNILHRDSLGSEQLIRPGQLNLMTAGHGVSHSEETRGVYSGPLHGVQLWVAQPSTTRDGAAAFEHHEELPRFEVEHGVVSVLVGDIGGVTSPARCDTVHEGAELDLRPGPSTVPLDPTHEYALAVLTGRATTRGSVLQVGSLGYLGTGHDSVTVDASEDSKVLLIGGEPFDEKLVMWWNYVARTREEVTAAHDSWSGDDGRFGTVDSPLGRIDVPGPPWSR